MRPLRLDRTLARTLSTMVLVATLTTGCLVPEYVPDTQPPPQPEPRSSPYAGQETREVKALSSDEVRGYLTGAGLGYAKSAELNHYPGPLHVLELADALALTPEQRARVQELRLAMLARAVPLGERYVAAEAAIEDAFRRGASGEEIRALLHEASRIEAELRFAHLEAHLATRALLTPEQVDAYDRLRGYAAPAEDDHAHDPAHAHG